jgi:hypothetical protein
MEINETERRRIKEEAERRKERAETCRMKRWTSLPAILSVTGSSNISVAMPT